MKSYKYINSLYLYSLTINLLKAHKSKNIDIDNEDELMKECSNNIISITSMPVLFSDIQELYKNNDDKLLKTLANGDLKICNELQKDFISVWDAIYI